MARKRKAPDGEDDVKKLVKEILDQYQWWWWMPAGSEYGKSNVDFNALKTGVFVAIETKFGANKITALQSAFLESVQSCDGFGFLVHEENIEWLRSFCAAFDRAATRSAKNEPEDEADGALLLNAIAAMMPTLTKKDFRERFLSGNPT